MPAAYGGGQENPSDAAAAAIPFPKPFFLTAAAFFFEKSAEGEQKLGGLKSEKILQFLLQKPKSRKYLVENLIRYHSFFGICSTFTPTAAVFVNIKQGIIT